MLGISVDRTPAYLPDGQQAARVYTVDLNGPGDKAGLEVDDLIYEADGVRVETSQRSAARAATRHAAGEEMILKVCRGGEYLTVSVTLEAKNEESMKKNKQFPAAMILLAVVSAVCYKGMRAIENKLKAKKEKSQK